MINEQTIENLVDKFEEVININKTNKKLSEEQLKNLNWLIYDFRKDLIHQNFNFEGLYSEFELNEKCETRCTNCAGYVIGDEDYDEDEE